MARPVEKRGRAQLAQTVLFAVALLFASICTDHLVIDAIAQTTTTTTAANTRTCIAGLTTTIQVTNSWLEFCPCSGTAASIDSVDGNDNGCISIQVAKVTTSDSSQIVYADVPPTPFYSAISKAVTDPTTGNVISGGATLPIQQAGQNLYAIPTNTAAYPSGVSIDTYETNYGSGATLTGVQVTGEGSLYFDGGLTQQTLRRGDRMLFVRCNEDRDALDHNIYLRIKVYGQPSANIVNYADFLTSDFLTYLLATDSQTPPQQFAYNPAAAVIASGNSTNKMLSISNVYGQNWLRVFHRGDLGHPASGFTPSFVFGIQLLPLNSSLITTTTPTPTTTTTTDDTTTTTVDNATNTTTDDDNETDTTTTTAYVGGAAGRRTTTPVPASAPPRTHIVTAVVLASLVVALCWV